MPPSPGRLTNVLPPPPGIRPISEVADPGSAGTLVSIVGAWAPDRPTGRLTASTPNRHRNRRPRAFALEAGTALIGRMALPASHRGPVGIAASRPCLDRVRSDAFPSSVITATIVHRHPPARL